MALAYQYDASGYFVGEVEDYGLLPNNATYTAPKSKDGFIACWTGSAWEQIENHKGKEGYLNGEPHTIKEYGPLPDEWTMEKPAPNIEQAKLDKLASIIAETEANILAGFNYEVDGQRLHFSYQYNDQQNFADTANMATFGNMSVPGVPDAVTWNGWLIEKDKEGKEIDRSLVLVTLSNDEFLALYMQGALAHKAKQMAIGSERKAKVDVAESLEELEFI